MQSRVVSDPVKSKLIGAHKEYWFFYVKHRDLAGREDFTEMMLDADKDMSSYRESAQQVYYHFANGINWVKLCLERCVEEYFKDEHETWNNPTIDTMPVAKVMQKNWQDSMILDDATVVADVDVDADADGTITSSEIDRAMRQWSLLRDNNLTDMDYEDYLRTYGVETRAAEHHRPELIRYIREWTYPVNHVEPTTGVPSSALSWSVQASADKDRYFKEPGFLFGLTTTRPKIYFQRTLGNGSAMLDDAFSWLPALLKDAPETSLKHFAPSTGPMGGSVTDADGYWIDVRDLYLYGDQFINYVDSDTDSNLVSLFSPGIKEYVASADIDELFADAANGNNLVREDGVVSLDILGTQMDHTPTTPGL